MKSGLNTFAKGISRRDLVVGATQGLALGGLGIAASTFSGAAPWSHGRSIPTKILGAGAKTGHLLRGGMTFPTPTSTEKKRVVIVGGGISGLAAAWWLTRRGMRRDEVLLLELEDEFGGSSRGGANGASAYPWGAHYLPIPGGDAVYVRTFLEQLGVINGYDDGGSPIYDESSLCAAPRERLMLHGRWQEGLVPSLGATPDDHRQYKEFGAAMRRYHTAVGNDGKRAFVIPVDLSSSDPEYRNLDRLSMTDLMAQRGWNSPYLAWYVNYCCRDDFGTTADQTSAWAGVHYFAARNGAAANAEENAVLTWPEGNFRLVRGLRELSSGEMRAGALVFDVTNGASATTVDYFDVAAQRTHRIEAETVIFAAPRFVAAHVLADYRSAPPAWTADFSYAPWMVANITLENLPDGEKGEESRAWRFAWDNVSYTSDSLGYVHAAHQSLAAYHRETVLTHYWPLTDVEPRHARATALARSPESWRDQILADLSHMHPGIDQHVRQIDVWLWGHGMIRPTVGFIWGNGRDMARASVGRVHFAHSDMSGISIFEEAQYRGVKAAEAALGALA